MMEALIGSWVFLVGYALSNQVLGAIISRWFSNKELRSAREYGDELLCKEQSKRTGVELELAKARQANVDTARANGQLLRDKDQLNEQIHNQTFTIGAFQKRETELDKAKAELINKAMQYYVLSNECNQLRTECQVAVDQRNELRKQAIDLRIDLDRNMDVFNDLAIHLQDMAAAIVSVAPDAKGD